MEASLQKSDQLNRLLTTYRPLQDRSVFVVSNNRARVTIQSQQYRALNLVYLLHELQYVAPDKHIAILGGGVAGVTAAMAAACLGCRVVLFEKRHRVLGLQQGCDTRWVHPNVYDWPLDGSERDVTNLPFLNWRADTVRNVISSLRRQWEDFKGFQHSRRPRVVVHEEVSYFASETLPGTTGTKPRERVVFQKHTTLRSNRVTDTFDVVIIAIGFGEERGVGNTKALSYWRNDDLGQLSLGRTQQHLVVGAGDGGVIDTLRLTIEDFRADLFDEQFFYDLPALRAALCKIHQDLRQEELPYEWLHERIADVCSMHEFDSFSRRLKDRKRRDTSVTLLTRSREVNPYSASFQNLFLLEILTNRIDGFVEVVEGELHDTVAGVGQDPSTALVLKPGVAKSAAPADADLIKIPYDRIHLRLGPSSPFEQAEFPLLQAIKPHMNAGPVRTFLQLDPTREPVYGTNVWWVEKVLPWAREWFRASNRQLARTQHALRTYLPFESLRRLLDYVPTVQTDFHVANQSPENEREAALTRTLRRVLRDALNIMTIAKVDRKLGIDILQPVDRDRLPDGVCVKGFELATSATDEGHGRWLPKDMTITYKPDNTFEQPKTGVAPFCLYYTYEQGPAVCVVPDLAQSPDGYVHFLDRADGGTQDRPGAAPPVDGYHSEPILDLFMYPEGVDRNLPPYRTLMTAPVLATDGDGYMTIVAVVNVTSGQPYDFSAPDFGWLQSCCAALGQIFVIYEEFLPDSYSRSSTPTAPLPD